MNDAFSESRKELLAASRLGIRTVFALHAGFTHMFRRSAQHPDGWIPLLAAYLPEHRTVTFMRLDSAGSMQRPVEGAEFARALSLVGDLSATVRRETRADGSLGPVGAHARMLWSAIVEEAHFMANGLDDDPVAGVLKNAVRVHSLLQFGVAELGEKIDLAQLIGKVQERFGHGEVWAAPGTKLAGARVRAVERALPVNEASEG